MDTQCAGPLRRRRMELRTITEGVGALIRANKTDRYLFLLRNTGSYAFTWALPGGKLDINESMDLALAREIQEELGGMIVDAELVLIERFVSNNGRFHYHTYFVDVDDEFVPVLNSEHVGYAWLPLASAPRPLHPGLQRTLTSQSVLGKIATVVSNL